MGKKPITRLLLVEDNPGDALLLCEMLKEPSSHIVELTQVECMRDAEKHLAERAVDIVLLDLGLPDTKGLDALRRSNAAAPRVPIVVLTGLDDESVALEALKEGAQDYLVKGQINDNLLVVTEVCCYPDGGTSLQKILVAKTADGWRVLNPVS